MVKGNCVRCGTPYKKTMRNVKDSGGPYCVECTEQNRLTKRKQTNLAKYGKDPNKTMKLKHRIRMTNLDVYGGHPSKTNEMKKRVYQTMKRRFGDNPMRIQSFKRKRDATNKRRYNGHPMQNTQIAEKALKNAYKLHDYEFPSGKVVKVQGYEMHALNRLIHVEHVKEDDIVVKRDKIPTIWYKDDVGGKHRYFVDIYIPSQRRMIQVKSSWTLGKRARLTELAAKECRKSGYSHVIWIFDQRGVFRGSK